MKKERIDDDQEQWMLQYEIDWIRRIDCSMDGKINCLKLGYNPNAAFCHF
jgi:hypothetical protein